MPDVQQAIERWVERRPPAQWLGGSLVTAVTAVAGMVAVDALAADVVLAVIGCGALGFAGLAARVHARLRALPLELATTLVRGTLDGQDAYWVRACLGRGRGLQAVEVAVYFEPCAGEEVALEPLVGEIKHLVGPMTVAIVDRDGVLTAPGTLRIIVQGTEAGHPRRVEGRFPLDAAEGGRFAPAWIRGRAGWEPDVSGWRQLR